MTSSGRVVVLLTIMGWFAMTSCASAPPPIRLDGTGTVTVRVTGFTSSEGQALLSLYLTEDGFPNDPDLAHTAEKLAIQGGVVEFVFRDVPAGSFAVAVFHDANSNLELDTNFLGIPTESWGVSKDAGGFLGPPSFEQARLELAAGEELEITFPVG